MEENSWLESDQEVCCPYRAMWQDNPTLTSLLHNPIHPTSSLHISLTPLSVLSSHAFHAVAQFVEALRYKPEGRKFDSRWGPMEFFILFILTDSACEQK
jgi:hypothetical protein